MRKKKKDLPMTLLVHLARVDQVTYTKKGPRPYAVTDVFVLGESKEQIEEQLPGLLKRGFQVMRYYRLTPSEGQSMFVQDDAVMPIVLPKSGLYETAEWLFRVEGEGNG